MNITMICNGLVPPPNYGGTERVVNWLVKELAALGHRVTLIAAPGSSVPEAAAVIEFPFCGQDRATLTHELQRLVPPDTDIIHDHCCYGEFPFPVLRTMHGLPAQGERLDERFCFVSNAHRYVAGKPRNPFVHNGIDLDEYEYRENKDPFFLFIGKVDWNVKGLNIAIEVAKRSRTGLIIAGDFLDPGFLERDLRHHLSPLIQYVGPVGGNDKRELLSAAKGLIFPTRWPEPFGLVAVEAMASGTPVITTWNGALPEIIVQGRSGIMCDSIDELSEAVGKIDQLDPRECRHRVESAFTATRMAERYLRLYSKEMERHKYVPETAEEKVSYWQEKTADRPWEMQGWLELADAALSAGRTDMAIAALKDISTHLPHEVEQYRYLLPLLRSAARSTEAAALESALKARLETLNSFLT